jgi:hypothetical protein
VAQSERRSGGPVRPFTALAFATVGFIALLIFGLGMLSLFLDQEVIGVPGLGQFPGILGTALAVVAFAAVLWSFVRQRHPSFWGALPTALAPFAAYIAGVWIGAVATGADLAAATSAAGGVATSWFGVVVAASGLVSGWAGIALVRTKARRPRWPWEGEEE